MTASTAGATAGRCARAAVLMALACGTGGCRLFHHKSAPGCHEPQPHATATSVPAIQAPEGLAAPNTHNALAIPDVPPGARTRSPLEPCLDDPPSFFPDRPKPSAKPPAKGPARSAAAAPPVPGQAPAAAQAPSPATVPAQPPAQSPAPAPAPAPSSAPAPN